METDIVTDDSKIEMYLKYIKENTTELLKQKIPTRTLMQNAIPRGFKLMKGQLDKQTIIDLCSIALTIVIQET